MTKHVTFGQKTVKRYCVQRDATLEPYKHDPRQKNYQHSEWRRSRKPKPSAKAALRRAATVARAVGTSPAPVQTDLAVAPGNQCQKHRKNQNKNATALPVRGGSWIIDSGSAFDIVSPSDLTNSERKRIEKLSMGVQLRTAAGDLTTDESVPVRPFGGDETIDALVLPDSPAL